jgi:hypothetical protein
MVKGGTCICLPIASFCQDDKTSFEGGVDNELPKLDLTFVDDSF